MLGAHRMQSSLLAEYLRTGTIPPLAKGDSKRQVGAKLGPPDDWKGRIPHIGWEESPFADFHDSWAWHYGSLCICTNCLNATRTDCGTKLCAAMCHAPGLGTARVTRFAAGADEPNEGILHVRVCGAPGQPRTPGLRLGSMVGDPTR